jgi:hypothetical protein
MPQQQNPSQQYMPGPPQGNPNFSHSQSQPVMQIPHKNYNNDFEDFLSANFVQNQMKNVDLSEDERALLHTNMMEADN